LICETASLTDDETHSWQVVGIANVGPLIYPPLGGIVYSQAGIFAAAALGMDVLVLDLLMRMLLIEKVAARYVWTPPTNGDESPPHAPNGSPSRCREESSPTETSPLLSSEDVLRESFIAPTRSRIV
jgi:hypothetical protein